MPFDRLVHAVDEWARHAPGQVFAQIGLSDLRPKHMQWIRFLAPDSFLSRVRAAELLVAHAGMGSIITALEYGKPILVMPRRGDLGETRNDHQVATAQRFSGVGLVEVAFDEQELAARLDRLVSLPPARLDGLVSLPTASRTGKAPCPHRSADCAWLGVAPCDPHPGIGCPHLLASLRDFVVGTPVARVPPRRPAAAVGSPVSV
jgi:UDP-N-acetylglucosamine transferase subunit ALG13